MIALVLASCSKGAKEAAPSATPTKAEPTTDSDGARQKALEEARNAAMMGVSAPTTAFDPIPDDKGTEPPPHQPKEGSTPPPKPPPKTKGSSPPPKPPPTTQGSQAPVGGSGGGGSTDLRKPTTAPQFGTTIGRVTLAGSPAPDELSRLIRTRNAEVQACYTKSLASFPELVGKLDITFVVAASGAIGEVTIEASTVKNLPLESCVVGVLQKARLETPVKAEDTPGAVTITFAKK